MRLHLTSVEAIGRLDNGWPSSGGVPPEFCWTMVNVNGLGQQGDANLISTDGCAVALIDVGGREAAERMLLPYLDDNLVDSLDMVFISHAHSDHYGGLDALLDHGVRMRQVYFNLPDRGLCEQETPWGCNYGDVLRVRARLAAVGAALKDVSAGQRFALGPWTSLEVLYAFDGVDTPVGQTDINDTSVVMKLRHRRFSMLFTGDLNDRIGAYLAATADDIGADVLKVPHHAIESVAPDEFFACVAPRCGLVSAPREYWLGEQSQRVRAWFAERNIPLLVNGVCGHISVTADADSLTISTGEDFPAALGTMPYWPPAR